MIQPRTGRFLSPRPLDRAEMTIKPGDDPRVALADWITDPKDDAFAGAMVNRLWKHLLGVGLVEPVNDLRAGNPPTNHELWKMLVQEFKTYRYDMKYIMRLILNSRTYQLASRTRSGNQSDARFYSHYYARRLPAESLLDAVGQATGSAEKFAGYPAGMPARQLPDPSSQSYFLSLFGRPERVTACACERNGEITLTQLLHLENGEDVLRKVRDPDGRLERLLAGNEGDDAIVDDLFLADALSIPQRFRAPRGPEIAGREPGRTRGGVPRPVLGTLEFKGILVQSLITETMRKWKEA